MIVQLEIGKSSDSNWTHIRISNLILEIISFQLDPHKNVQLDIGKSSVSNRTYIGMTN